MVTVQEIIVQLEAQADPDNQKKLEHFGIKSDQRLGVRVPDLRKMAKQFGTDHQLALDLWDTGIDDARLLASMIDDAKMVSESQMEKWVSDFQSWDVCDQVCMNLFDRTPYAREKITEWSRREAEYEKRAGYVLIACLAMHDKQAPDEEFTGYFPLIREGSTDPRNFVKKGVNWALRGIGKRNRELNQAALEFAAELAETEDPTARWIARDAIRDLQSDAVKRRLDRIDARKSVQK